jgi:hypothetical protein
MSSVIIGLSDWSLTSQSDFTEKSVMTTAEPLTRYGAIEGRASRAALLPPANYTTPRGTTFLNTGELAEVPTSAKGNLKRSMPDTGVRHLPRGLSNGVHFFHAAAQRG